MRVPLEWLKEYVPIRLAPEALAERLTMAGLEVAGIERADGDHVLVLEVTPNRADCLSIIGVAREVAVLTNQRLRPPSVRGSGVGGRSKAVRPRAQSPAPRTKFILRIEDQQGCQRYIGRLINDVRIGPSPAWMQKRLAACGVRPINNVVDVTNYVLLECGQPLHAFDFDRLAQGTILVRRAQTQERLTTLDAVPRTLSQETLVIADARQPVAVAGIMGGSGSEVVQQTRAVLLESALFDPLSVRRTARKLGLATESSYRFERGVDPVGVESASLRASALIQELAGGEELACVEAGSKPLKRTGIVLDAAHASRWLGMPLSPTAVRTTLARLSCHVASSGSGGALHVGVPSFRRDLVQDVDLYEELARTAGYDRLPSSIPTAPMAMPCSEEVVGYRRAQSLRCLCASLGLTEVITWSLISAADLARCAGASAEAIRLANPLSQDHALLRPSLLVGLLQVVRRNLTQGVSGVRLFELGNVTPPGESETRHLGIALAGEWARDWRTQETADFFRLKGLVQALVLRLCDGALQVAPARHPWAGQSAELMLNGRAIGSAGQVARAITQALDLECPVWVAELSVEALTASRRQDAAVHPPAHVPPVKRDLSVFVGDSTTYEEVVRAIREAAGALAERVELIDRFTGQQVPSGKYSLTFSIDYRDPSRTLTAAEVDAVHQRIGQALVSQLNAQLR